jgi:hypothetical protein
MTCRASILLLLLSRVAGSPALGAGAQSAPQECASAAECRAQTEAAIARQDYERAHDLAWRATQRGPRNDAALMFLLARAQALSGRPDDALVMLRRLAELGVAADASTEEFRRTRDLPGWPAVEELLARGAKGDPVTTPAGVLVPVKPLKPAKPPGFARTVKPESPPRPASGTAPAEPVEPAEPAEPVAAVVVDSAGRFSSPEFAPGGLACDAVSRRFVFGDRPGRKLRVVAEGADSSVDLTRAASAGFLDVMALDIDAARGELWVASAEADGGSAVLHKLQLVSGRVLARYEVPARLAPVIPIDVTVTSSGMVLILDSAGSRLIALRPGAPALEVMSDLTDLVSTSLTSGGRDGVAYIAHRDGISRVDLRTRAVTPMGAPARTSLAGIERLRRHGSELVGVQALPNGSRRLVRLGLNAAGLAVSRLRVVGAPMPSGKTPTLATVCGDTLAYLVGETAAGVDGPTIEWTLLRIRLAP